MQPALLLDVLGKVTRQRRDQMHPMVAVERGHVLITLVRQDRQIRPNDNGEPASSRRTDELSKVRIHLRRTARNVDRTGVRTLRGVEHQLHRLPTHLFSSSGRRLDVTMLTREIASQTDVHLNRVDRYRTQRSTGRTLDLLVECVVTGYR